MTQSDFLKDEPERMTEQPTLAQIAARIKALPPVVLDEPPHATLRTAREARGKRQ